MKNHVLRPDRVGEKDPLEPGERCCIYTGVFSLRRDLLIRDSILMGGFPQRELMDYTLPGWHAFNDIVTKGYDLWFSYGTGNVPPMVMARTDWVKEQSGASFWRGKLLDFKKPKQAA
jgi:hypothetical protein